MVERSLSMREAPGSIPGFSNLFSASVPLAVPKVDPKEARVPNVDQSSYAFSDRPFRVLLPKSSESFRTFEHPYDVIRI